MSNYILKTLFNSIQAVLFIYKNALNMNVEPRK